MTHAVYINRLGLRLFKPRKIAVFIEIFFHGLVVFATNRQHLYYLTILSVPDFTAVRIVLLKIMLYEKLNKRLPIY